MQDHRLVGSQIDRVSLHIHSPVIIDRNGFRPEAIAQVRVNGSVLFDNGDDFNGDVNGDFTGSGGTTMRTFIWANDLSTADFNADITTMAEGSFRMVVEDAEGMVVLDRGLSGDTDLDSFSGVTESGASGIWSVTITLINITGDGSFSFSQGN